jgi:hypothetical protein
MSGARRCRSRRLARQKSKKESKETQPGEWRRNRPAAEEIQKLCGQTDCHLATGCAWCDGPNAQKIGIVTADYWSTRLKEPVSHGRKTDPTCSRWPAGVKLSSRFHARSALTEPVVEYPASRSRQLRAGPGNHATRTQTCAAACLKWLRAATPLTAR